MANSFLKSEKHIVSAALGLLARESVLPRLVWRDAAHDFTGAKDDTISIRVPAFTAARSRALRSGDTRTRDTLTERKVDITLDTDIYKDIILTDENLTLDISDFGAQVLTPAVAAIIRGIDDAILSKMQAATYANTITYDYSSGNAWIDLILKAREYLNKARVPMSGRVLAVGSGIETELLGTDLFVKANESGSTNALSEATLGRKAGFEVVSVPSLGPDEAYAFHKTAVALAERAPIVPAGAPWGQSMSFDGFAVRAVRILDSATIEDILALDAWVGASMVTDDGWFDADGLWVPSDAALGTEVTGATIEADDDTVTKAGHGLANGDRIVFTSLTGGAGLSTGREYFVIGVAGDDFQVSDTVGGSAVAISTDYSDADFRKNGTGQVVRAVKITAVA